MWFSTITLELLLRSHVGTPQCPSGPLFSHLYPLLTGAKGPRAASRGKESEHRSTRVLQLAQLA